MDKKIIAVAFMVLMLAPAVPMQADDADGYGILLYEVNRTDADEGVSIRNYSSSDIDLEGYYISDGEGKAEFTSSFILGSGDAITVVRAVTDDSDFQGRFPTYTDGDRGLSIESKFNLATSGDEVFLYKGDTLIDAFCFGNKTIDDGDTWSGDSFTFRTGCFAVRASMGHTSSDWINYKQGLTNNSFDPDLEFDATVTPFLFPESGGIPIYRALESAKDTVYITMYELTSKNLYGLLCDLEERTGEDHVDVVVMLEASPLGYSSFSSDSRYMKALVDSGGEVYFIGGTSSDRYTYVHAKYCIIDSEKVIVTSENWTTGNLNGSVCTDPYSSSENRGWGAIIESKEYASFMSDVFWADLDTSMSDITAFDDYVVNTESADTFYDSPDEDYETFSVSAKVTPVMSPDSSSAAFTYYIDNAVERVYSEQQDISSSYANISNESPVSHMASASERGVDSRFILCSTNNEDASTLIDRINLTSHIKACTMSKPYVHNKGLICDDTALVSSVNWTSTSINNNREMAVAIHSSAIADFFAQSFVSDFNRNYTYSGLDVELTEGKDSYASGEQITFTVSVDQEGTYSYQWDLNGTSKTTVVPRTSYSLDDGEYTLIVTVTDGSGSSGQVSKSFTVGDPVSEQSSSSSIFDKIGVYLAPAIAVITAALAAVIKLFGGKGR